MEPWFDHIMLSRIQFGLTTMFHIMWPVLIVGLSLFMVVLEALWMRTGDALYYRHARFWGKFFLLATAVGVASGIPLEFQFGTNWNQFSLAGGDFFGHMLGFEGAMAFMLEASFLGIMMFGWKRVSPRMHLFASCMVALGASLSAFWIMVANSWMHTPTGGYFHNGQFVITSHWAAIFNPDMPWGVSHMWVACLEISLFVIGGISAWHLRKGAHVAFFSRSFKMALGAAIVVAPLQILLGDGSGKAVFEHQAAKLAAIEAHWHTNPAGEGASWKVLAWPDRSMQGNRWALEIPNGLSLIATGSLTGTVKGLTEFPVEDQPPIVVPFYSFRLMIAAGSLLFLLALWTLWAWFRGRLSPERIVFEKGLLFSWMAAIPISYIAMETGWLTRELGRQPWVLYGLMRTSHGATKVSAATVGASLLVFTVVYTVIFVLFLLFARRILSNPEE
jgi:cytochrome bd ubiquinol oxidase subunit I